MKLQEAIRLLAVARKRLGYGVVFSSGAHFASAPIVVDVCTNLAVGYRHGSTFTTWVMFHATMLPCYRRLLNPTLVRSRGI
jgi:hypothetical protein